MKSSTQHHNDDDNHTMHIHNFYSGRFATIRQLGHHFKIEAYLDELDENVDRLLRKTKTKIDASTVILDERKFDLTADQEVDRELNLLYSCREILSSKYMICPKCKQKILICCHHDHNLICFRFEQEQHPKLIAESHDRDVRKVNISVRPHTLRYVRLIGVSCNSMHIAWDSPIFDGGEKIIDLEISYSCETDGQKDRGKRVKMSCLRWCNKEPSPMNRFIINGLKASTHYSVIMMRCRNKIGWSDYSEAIDCVKTGDPEHPTPPQRFEVTSVTSNSLSFSWTPPFNDGGGEIMTYELTYEQSVPVYVHTSGIRKKEIAMQRNRVVLGKDKMSLTLSGLPGDTSFKSVSLSATNSYGLISTFVSCENVRTSEPSKVESIREEIERVRATKEKEIDSDFFQPGVVQRVEKNVYLGKLKDLLSSVLDEDISLPLNLEEASVTDRIYKQNEAESAKCSPFHKRMENFKFRIDLLRQEIDDYEESTKQLKQNRIALVRSMQIAQERIYVLQAELYNLVNSIEVYSSSTVLNGSVQRMKTIDLRYKIEKEVAEKMTTISSNKRQIVLDDKEYTRIDERIKTKEEELKERLSSYHSFMQQIETVSNIKSRISQQTNEALMKNALNIWFRFKENSKQRRVALEAIANQLNHLLVLKVMRVWCNNKNVNCRNVEKLNTTNTFCGNGSFMLAKVLEKRISARDEVISAIIEMRPNDVTFLPRNTSIDVSQLPSRVALGISRGDYYHSLESFDDAIASYQNVLQELSNTSMLLSESLTYWSCIVQERIAFIYMKTEQWNKAILQLEMLLYQAQSYTHHQFTPCAEILLGKCYLESGEMKVAKGKLLNGLSKISGSDHQTHLLRDAYGGLIRYYNYVNDQTRSSYYKYRLDALDVDLNDKIKSTLDRVNNLEVKLMHISLGTGKTVEFQVASVTFINTHIRIKKLEASSVMKMKERKECKIEIENLHKLIQRIDKEIERCLSNGKKSQVSSLIHDNDQEIDTLELIDRLEARKQVSQEALHAGIQMESDLSLQIKNIDDEKRDLQEDLELEQSPLIQALLQKRRIRCMAFNELSKGGVNVYRRKCVGSQSIVLTYDKDIYVYDIYNGRLKHVFVGDEDDKNRNNNVIGHTATITCIFFYGDKIYSGSLDTTVICWSVSKECLEFVSKGHLAMVTSIYVDSKHMITGSVDKSVILWDAYNGCMLYKAMGHSRGITCLHYRSLCNIISVDMDSIIMIWDLDTECNKLRRKYEIRGTKRCKMNVVKSSNQEIICGDGDGFVSIWWLETGEILQRCKVHKKGITDLQFDATLLVTCGRDCVIKVLDVTTCQTLCTIKGNTGPVLSVCFDRTSVLSLSNDGIMKQWLWQPTYGSNMNSDFYHTFTEGDSLHSICKRYGVRLKNLKLCNENRDLQKLTTGQKLIVIKGQNNFGVDKGYVATNDTTIQSKHQQRNQNDGHDLASRLSINI